MMLFVSGGAEGGNVGETVDIEYKGHRLYFHSQAEIFTDMNILRFRMGSTQ